MINTELRNRYRLVAELGRGAMGTVYRAYDILLQRDVAVKLVSNVGLGAEGRARLLHEARAAAKLNHPNIITVYDAGETDNQPFIVMELLQGQTLREYTVRSIEETIELAKQICAALEHAHAAYQERTRPGVKGRIGGPTHAPKLRPAGLGTRGLAPGDQAAQRRSPGYTRPRTLWGSAEPHLAAEPGALAGPLGSGALTPGETGSWRAVAVRRLALAGAECLASRPVTAVPCSSS